MNLVAGDYFTSYLTVLYGENRALPLSNQLADKVNQFVSQNPHIQRERPGEVFSNRDVILRTYADNFQAAGEKPIVTLDRFINQMAGNLINTIHLLPFYPYSSDDGYAVTDYKCVNPSFGTWDDVSRLGNTFNLMFDGVFNHISSKSDWFQGFLSGNEKYQDYFIQVDPECDYSKVFRPRSTPPYSQFLTHNGAVYVWTTYSDDQIDLNYKNPLVLFEIIDIILLYASKGMDIIRLDGAAYLWKEPGTECINLPETHTLIRLFRSVLDIAAPQVKILTQTNVAHEDNLSYFGDGYNEAQLVYNFALPFMVLHAFHTRCADALSNWVKAIDWVQTPGTTYYNFLAGHDGIGLLPVYDILGDEAVNKVVEKIQSLGGNVSYRLDQDGTFTAYELNASYLDALEDPNSPLETQLVADRFIAAQAILLALPGIPCIYIHSLFGSRGWVEGVEQTGQVRTINREKFDVHQLVGELNDPNSLRHLIYYGYIKMIKVRTALQAFHPNGKIIVLDVDNRVFSILRISPDRLNHVICITNLSPTFLTLHLKADELPTSHIKKYQDRLSGHVHTLTEVEEGIELMPFQVLWLENLDGNS